MAPPIYKTKNGQFSAAIFENPKGKSIALQKSYTDKEGKWQNQTITVFPKDVPRLIGLLEEAQKQCEAPEGAASSSLEEEEEEIDDKEFFMTPVCHGYFQAEHEMTDAIIAALRSKGIEVRGWK